MDKPSTRRSESGFMLVEIVVAMVLVSVAVLALGVLMVRVSRTAASSSTTVYTVSAASAEASRITALPFDSVAALAPGCATVSTPPQPYQRCTTVNNVSSKVQQVTIVVTPSGNVLLHPDTVVMIRTKTGGNGVASTTFP